MTDARDADLIAELRRLLDRAGPDATHNELSILQYKAVLALPRLLTLAESALTARADALREAAEIALEHGNRKVIQFDEIVKRATIDGQKNLDGAAVAAASMAISGSQIATAILAAILARIQEKNDG